MTSAGRRRVNLWNVSTGMLLWTREALELPLALGFDEDDQILILYQINSLQQDSQAITLNSNGLRFFKYPEQTLRYLETLHPTVPSNFRG